MSEDYYGTYFRSGTAAGPTKHGGLVVHVPSNMKTFFIPRNTVGSPFSITAGKTCASMMGHAKFHVQRVYVVQGYYIFTLAAPSDRGWKCVVVCRALTFPT